METPDNFKLKIPKGFTIFFTAITVIAWGLTIIFIILFLTNFFTEPDTILYIIIPAGIAVLGSLGCYGIYSESLIFKDGIITHKSAFKKAKSVKVEQIGCVEFVKRNGAVYALFKDKEGNIIFKVENVFGNYVYQNKLLINTLIRYNISISG